MSSILYSCLFFLGIICLVIVFLIIRPIQTGRRRTLESAWSSVNNILRQYYEHKHLETTSQNELDQSAITLGMPLDKNRGIIPKRLRSLTEFEMGLFLAMIILRPRERQVWDDIVAYLHEQGAEKRRAILDTIKKYNEEFIGNHLTRNIFLSG